MYVLFQQLKQLTIRHAEMKDGRSKQLLELHKQSNRAVLSH